MPQKDIRIEVIMSYRILVDSCGELTEQMKKDTHFVSIPLTLFVDRYTIVDDETFDQKDFLKKVAESPTGPKSACPSPEKYREEFDCDADHVYAVTLSAELSGSYNSAEVGKNMLLEEKPDKKVYVFNSRSASIGETLIALKIQECEEAGMDFDTVVKTVEEYIDSQKTWFVLESLDALRKNGRLSLVKSVLATALKIKPVMMSTPKGEIDQLAQVRGINKAIMRMADAVIEYVGNEKDRVLAISHCNCPKRAETLKEYLESKLSLKKIIVLDTAGVSSLYASDGGVIVVV